jgi:glutathione S-transferase
VAERAIDQGLLARTGIGHGLTLVQVPPSPFCISVRTALEAGGVPHRVHDVELWDRRPVAELTGGAYYVVPVLVDTDRPAPVVVYESRDDGTEIARYVDAKYGLGLFPAELEGLQDLVVQYVEGQCEDVAFRLDDAFLLPGIPDVAGRTMALRHKERKFGKGCVDQWRAQAPELLAKLTDLLRPLDTMLARSHYLLGDRPTFADYALYGVLGNLTYTGDLHVPGEVTNIVRWHAQLPAARIGQRVPAPA